MNHTVIFVSSRIRWRQIWPERFFSWW